MPEPVTVSAKGLKQVAFLAQRLDQPVHRMNLKQRAELNKANIGFVFGTDVSPTRTRLIGELAAKYSAARFYQYEALAGSGSR